VNFSPDRKNVAVTIIESAGSRNIWIYDVFRGLRTRFTFDHAVDSDGAWSPDGKSVVFRSDRGGSYGIYRKPADSSASEELLYADNLVKLSLCFSPDGKHLAYDASDSNGSAGIWILPDPLGPAGVSKPFPFVQGRFRAWSPQFSPDGKWVAYWSNESGRNEIYAAPFPGPGGKRQISTSGGTHPRWRADGKELFYSGPGQKLMAAGVNIKGGALEVGKAEPLFSLVSSGHGRLFNYYDVSADGQHFLAIVPPEQPSPILLTVLQNWTAGLKK